MHIRKVSENVTSPSYATDGSAGLDLSTKQFESIPPRSTRLVGLGVQIALPAGTVGLLAARSSLWKKTGLILSNSVGVIDEDYRGELMASLWNPTDNNVTIEANTPICQLLIVPVLRVDLIEVDRLPKTERGTGGFGSTDR